MPLSPDHVGRLYPPIPPYEISRAKVDELIQVLNDSSPPYLLDPPFVPPTFSAVATHAAWDQVLDDPDLGLELKRVIHADQSFDIIRPLRVGEIVHSQAQIESVKIRGTLEYLQVRVDVRDNAGHLVGVSRSTFVHSRVAPTDSTQEIA